MMNFLSLFMMIDSKWGQNHGICIHCSTSWKCACVPSTDVIPFDLGQGIIKCIF